MGVLTGGLQLRRFPLGLEIRDMAGNGDGRTVYGRIVPYGEVIAFVDEYDGNKIKRERFHRGALADQVKAWHRVTLTFDHLDGFANTIGYGRQLQELDDGAYATFRLYERDAAKAKEMIEDSHRGLSLEFYAKDDRNDPDGVIGRYRVDARRVTLTNDPAYTGSEVLAVRERSAIATPNLDSVLADLEALKAGSHDSPQ